MYSQSNFQHNTSSIFDYIPRETLDEVCKYLSKTTNIFTGVEDYQGNMISFYMGHNSCDICRQRRIYGREADTCKRIDSFAAIEASRKKKTFIYVCPYGLIDFCAPIVINNSFQGALFMGQMLTDEETMKRLPHFNVPIADNQEIEKKLQKQYEAERKKLKPIPAQQLTVYMGLLAYAANYLSELGTAQKNKKIIIQLHEEIKKKNWEMQQHKLKNLATESHLSSLLSIQHFTIDSLNMINQLTILEEAPHTYENIRDLLQILQYIYDSNDLCESIEKEISYLRKYLSLEKYIHANVTATLDLNISNLNFQIPRMILLQLADNAFTHAFSPENKAAKLNILLSDENAYIKIQVLDNGQGVPKQISSELLQYVMNPDLPIQKNSYLYLLLRNLRFLYGNDFRFDINGKKQEGSTVTILIPKTRSSHD